MNLKLLFCAFFLILMSFGPHAQETFEAKRPKELRVIETYGYLKGQQYSLDYIKSKYPNLELEVYRVGLSFKNAFGKAKENIRNSIVSNIGEVEFEKREKEIEDEYKNLFTNQDISEDVALNFLAEVENRAKGNIEINFLQVLLMYQFQDYPIGEFMQGFTTKFSTKGHSKSKGTDWQIEIPLSWSAEEGDRPNIIKKFRSEFGFGGQNIMLMVKDLPFPDDYKLTEKDIEELFSETEMRNMVPNGGKYISSSKMIFDGSRGGMLEFEQELERLDYQHKIRMVHFIFLKNNKFYFLQCSVEGEIGITNLSVEMKKYLPFFKLVANSIVVNSNY